MGRRVRDMREVELTSQLRLKFKATHLKLSDNKPERFSI